MMKKFSLLLFLLCALSLATVKAQGSGNALNFDGTSNGYVSLPSAVYFDDNTFTIEAWVNLKSYGKWCRLIDFYTTSNSDNVIAALCDGSLNYYPHLDISGNDGSGTTGCSASQQIPLNTWTHIAYVLDGSNGYIYINGTKVGTATDMRTPVNVSRTNNYIAKSAWGDNAYPNMKLDEFRIWTTARSADEINANMNK